MIFVIAAPGAEGPELRDALARSPDLEAVDGDAHGLVDAEPDLHPANRGWDGNRLGAGDADGAIAGRLRGAVGDRAVLHSTHDTLRVGFLHAVFPDATFVLCHRDPAQAVPTALDRWEAGTDVTYPDLPGWEGLPWSFALIPRWRSFAGQPLVELVAAQWETTTRIAVGDLQRLPAGRYAVVDHALLAAEPAMELGRLWAFAGAAAPTDVPGEFGTAVPAATAAVEAALSRTFDTAEVARTLFASPARRSAGEPLRSVSTDSFADVLQQVGGSLLVSTYQTNKVVIARRARGVLNTHFRAFDGPMGLAHRDGRLAIGTRTHVHEYRDVPAATARLAGPVDHDACFIERRSHHTGDVRVHDLAFAGDELWFVATRFSCLATLDEHHSFVPRWTPPFITALAAEDRCHLNGMCVIDNQVRFVTALGASDEEGGWRERRADGGIVIDVPSGEIVASGLSMPHSPRWHRDRLWILESGQGGIGTLDPATGEYEQVAQVPGFTRGLSFHGSLAFIGLSEVREATTFGGLPLTARLEERQCGVWVVDIDSGQTVAFLRFEDVVQELFEVLLLPGTTFPEIAEPGSEIASTAFVLPQ